MSEFVVEGQWRQIQELLKEVERLKKSEAFVVWVEWSTGDSFGHGERCRTEVLGLFKSYDDAEVLKDAIEASSNKYDRRGYENDGAAYWVKTPDGQIFTSGWAPWLGYFESLDSVCIDWVEVR